MRRILQAQGAEVIHLGHNRSVREVVAAAIQEDVQGVAISAYQGGHVEYFSYLVELLNEQGAGHIKVYGGGGGVIVPAEIELLHSRGVAHIFSPADGQHMGLAKMINTMIEACDYNLAERAPKDPDGLAGGSQDVLARTITQIEAGTFEGALSPSRQVPVLGITGTGGSGKSSLTDELVRRFRLDQQDKVRVAVLAVDPPSASRPARLPCRRARAPRRDRPRCRLVPRACRRSLRPGRLAGVAWCVACLAVGWS